MRLVLVCCRAKFDAMTEAQRNRYEEYRRSTLPKARMKKVRVKCAKCNVCFKFLLSVVGNVLQVTQFEHTF
jgi:hypothetical protein